VQGRVRSAAKKRSAGAALEPRCCSIKDRLQAGQGVRLAQESKQLRGLGLDRSEMSGGSDRRNGKALLDVFGSSQAIATVRKVDVDQCEIRTLAGHQLDQLLTRTGQAHDCMAKRSHLAPEMLCHEPAVLREGDAQFHRMLPAPNRPASIGRPLPTTSLLSKVPAKALGGAEAISYFPLGRARPRLAVVLWRGRP
jgi:hypothetical protein